MGFKQEGDFGRCANSGFDGEEEILFSRLDEMAERIRLKLKLG